MKRYSLVAFVVLGITALAAFVVPHFISAQTDTTAPIARALINNVTDGNPTGQDFDPPIQSVRVEEGYAVGLDGTGSSDNLTQDLLFSWSCTGTGGVLSDPTSNRPNWRAPLVNGDTRYSCFLRVTDQAGNISTDLPAAYALITVHDAPTVDIRANGFNGPIKVRPGAITRLTWTSGNTVSCLTTGFNGGSLVPLNNQSGVVVNPTVPTTYSITCGGGANQVTDSVQVNMEDSPLPEASITADRASVESGTGTTIRWCKTDTHHTCLNTFNDGCTVGTRQDGTDIRNQTPGSCFGSYATGNLFVSTTYYLTARGTGGTSRGSVTVNIGAPAAQPPVAPRVGARISCSPLGTQVLITTQTGSTYDIQKCVGAGCTNFSNVAGATGVVAQPDGRVFLDENAAANGTTYRYRAKAYNAAGLASAFSEPADLVFSDDKCVADPFVFLATLNEKGLPENGGRFLISAYPPEYSAKESGILRASQKVQFYSYGGEFTADKNHIPNSATQCTISGSEYAGNEEVREIPLSPNSCAGTDCYRNVGITSSLIDLSVLQPDQNGNPIDSLSVLGVCSIGAKGILAVNEIYLRPGDFSQATPAQNVCTETAAPVTVSWSASAAAAKYNVFRVIDANNDGLMQQAEIDAATTARTYDLNVDAPLLPATVCAGPACSWTDPSAQKNTRYLYMIRSRNSNGVAFSDIPGTPSDTTKYKPKAITTGCPPTARITANGSHDPIIVPSGSDVALEWTSIDANVCTSPDFQTNNAANGTQTVVPTRNTTYRLECAGATPPAATDSVTVNMQNRAPVAVAGVALPNPTGPRQYKGTPGNPLKVRRGEALTLWFAPFTGTLEAPTAFSKDPDDDTEPANGIYDGGICEWNDNLSINTEEPGNFNTEIDHVPAVGAANQPDPPGPFPRTCVVSANHTFQNAAGIYTYHAFRLKDRQGVASAVQDVTIQVVDAPIISKFTATPNPINQDQPFTLEWESANTANCRIDQGIGAVVASGNKDITDLKASPRTYTLTCDSPDTTLYPNPVTAAVPVSITAPICTSFAANPATTIKPGDPSLLSWNVPNARTCDIDQGIGAVGVNASREVRPNTATTYTLSCSGDGKPDCSQAATVSIANQPSTAKAGASLDTSPNRVYANTITVTEGASVKVYLSAAGSADSDGTLKLCEWNDDFNQDPPIDYELDVVVASPAGAITSQCDTTIASIEFPLPSEEGSPLGDHEYKVLMVTDDKDLVSVPATIHVNILPRLAVSLSAVPTSGDAPFSPTLRADITNYTGPLSDTGNFSIWWDCENTSNDIGVVSRPRDQGGCGPLLSDPTSGDIICGKNANGAKCDGVLLQGQEFLSTVVDPAYAARATAYIPKVIVERGVAVPAESRSSATANTPFTFTLAKEKDISVVQGATTNNTSVITATKTGGTGEAITFSATGMPPGASASFSPASCTPGASPCTSTLTVSTTKGTGATPAGTYSLTITGATSGGGSVNVPLTLSVSSSMDVSLTAPTSAVVGSPVAVTASVSNYTGDSQDTINYKFWKNCVSPESGNLSAIITACGNPDATFDGVSANPQPATLTYTTTGSFTPKVFVQRRAAAGEDRVDSPVVVSPAFNYALSNGGSVSILRGTTGTQTIQVTTQSGAPSPVSFVPSKVTGLPVGITASFSPSSCTPPATAGSSCTTDIVLSLAVPVEAAVTAAPLTITVTDNGPLGKTTTFPLSITATPPFTFTLAKEKDISVVQGATTNNTSVITATKTGGTGEAITFSATGMPPGASASFSPASCTPGASPCTSTLTVSTTKGTGATPAGTYSLTITGATSGGGSVNVPLTLSVSSSMDVSLTAPTSAVVGSPVAVTASVSNYTGDSQDTINYKFWKNCVSPESGNLSAIITACGNPDATFDGVSANPQPATLTYTTTGSFTPKVFVQRRAAAGEDRVDSPITISPVFDYTLGNSGDISIVQRQSGAVTLRVTHVAQSGAPGPVAFDAGRVTLTGQSGLPAGMTASISNSPCTPVSGGDCAPAPVLTLRTNQNSLITPAGTYDITVQDNTFGKTTAFRVNVLSQMSVDVNVLPAASGPAPLVVQLQADAPPADYTGDPQDPITYTFWKNCNQAGTDVGALRQTGACGTPDFEARDVRAFTIRTTDLIYTIPGTYQGKVVAQRGATSAEDRITIVVNPSFTYSLSVDRSRVELVQGTTVSSANRAVITNISGDPVAVPFSARVSNLPPAAPAPIFTFTPVSCAPPRTGSCASDLSVAVSREMSAGDYSVIVTAGSQSATFTLGVTSRINATLAAVPSASGPAPLSLQLRADTSAYTGSANDSLNYSFWWDCNNPSDNPSSVTAACGDPSDPAIGFKINGILQESTITPTPHRYNQEGIFFGKVIVERGSARREARIPVTVGSPRVSVTCTVGETNAVVNQPVTWTAVPVQGRAPFSFAWSRDVSCGINPRQCGSVEMRYASPGAKFGTVTVTDAEGDTGTRLCDNSVTVRQPTLVILPGTAQVRVDGDTLQFVAKFDPDGPDGTAPEQDVTTQATWTIPLSDQEKATISAVGRLTSGTRTGSLTARASYRDAFGNTIVATADVQVIPRTALVCDPATQTVRTNEPVFPMRATGGTGSYEWTVQEIDATPRTGTTVESQTFTTTFSQTGSKTVIVTSGSQSGSCRVTVTDQAASVNLSAFPASVTLPAASRLSAVVSGNALGTMNYSFWWDCGSDKDADNTTRVEIAEGRCGEIPHNVPSGQCQENMFGASCHSLAEVSKALDHIYQNPGTKAPKVIVERGSAAPSQAKASVAVDAANRAPLAVAGVSADQNANRAYSRSIVVTQNVPTRIFFGALIGRESAPEEMSSDPDGWTNILNGVYHPGNPAGTGQCAWNADLDRDAQVSFEDISGTNQNPAGPEECATSQVHTFAETGTYTYAVLRITDNRGLRSPAVAITVDVVSPGAPISLPGVSSDPSADRIYRDTVRVKQGETTQLWVSARRRVGTVDQVSSDPDGWRSRNGGVASGGSCRWNRDLDRGVFPAGVPTYEYIINDPQDPAEDCDTQLTNEAGTAFVRSFMDPPGIYAFETLRIFDNTGLRSNKGMVNVEVLPSDPPVAVASASTDNGQTFDDTITIVRGVSTTIVFSAAGSTDPDGWTNPINGVSAAGHCDWNSDLNQGAVTFENVIQRPASPSACNTPSRTFTFNDRPGVVDFQVLKVTDNKNFSSTPAVVSVRVTAPDLVISAGPVPVVPAGLVVNGSTAFTGTVRNQGDAGTGSTFNTRFTVDLSNDGTTDLTLGAPPAISGLATLGERSVTSGVWSNIPAGTHRVTVCADQPTPAVANEFFTDNNCASQVVTVLPDNRAPQAEAGISLDGVTYGSRIAVVRGSPVQVWLSADRDVNADGVASTDPDGWLDADKGVAQGGKCDWNIDLASPFVVQNTVNNPSSPTICNRNRMDKTFNDVAGTYVYPVLRVTDVRGAASNVAEVRVTIVSTATGLPSGCSAPGCVVEGGGPSGQVRPDLLVSRSPQLAEGRLERNRTVSFNGRIQNRSGVAVAQSFKNAFLVDLNNNGTVDVTLRSLPRVLTNRLLRSELAALPLSDLTLPLPANVAALGIDEEVTVTSGEWRTIPEGTHRITVCADSDNEVVEFDEDNNCASAVVTVTPPGGPGGPLRVQSCGVSAPTARAGQLVDWTATAAGSTGIYSYSWSGDVPLEGTSANPVSVAYQTTGTKSGSVVITSGSETAQRACGTVTIQPGIISFQADPRQINAGQTSTLSWNTTGFNSCAITADQPGQSIGAVETVGSRTIQPPRNTVYTLTCNGQGDSQSVTVVVSSTPRFEEQVPR